jgi:anthranilate synthase component 1
VSPGENAEKVAQGLFGYTSYDAIRFIEPKAVAQDLQPAIPPVRYRLYQYVIAINHFKDLMYICENKVPGIDSELNLIESLIRSKDVPAFPFSARGAEPSPTADEEYLEMVRKGIDSCKKGEVFQIVLSRSFSQPFHGDEFNVYRALRAINPSPYLFYFDYGDYRLMGSSPEMQLKVSNGKALVHAIAGTVRRTGDEQEDARLSETLLNDPKENAEHVMLVDLARNDLSRSCSDVTVKYYKQLQYYSHVIHLVSEVEGRTGADNDPFSLLASTFPAGTLSGAPKFRAMQLIEKFESLPRGYYGGCIGHLGFDGSCNHAIMIRTFLSARNRLHYRAGAGVVAASVPENELQEVNNKLAALKKAIQLAEKI